ncbi:MAG TPA: ABC transporter permease subunit [Solirubrobacterales bacterium]|nr:ABC transporter permease subunit [Solirubrobacterales bacterium]
MSAASRQAAPGGDGGIGAQARLGSVIARYAVRESLRRRVLPVVGALTAAFLVFYALGAHFAFRELGELETTSPSGFVDIDDRALAGATLTGLAMFATLFLGAVLATFLTLGVVRGDSETGLLQPLLARPVARGTILVARAIAAAAIAAAYVLAVFAVSVAITHLTGDYTPDQLLTAGLQLAAAVVVITCISVLVSVFTSSTAQGITVLMLFGAGLTAGLLGQIGDALESATLIDISEWMSWMLPFEALYQDALYALTAETSGVTGFLLSLGPFGGARDTGIVLDLFALLYCAGLLGLATAAFMRRDL